MDSSDKSFAIIVPSIALIVCLLLGFIVYQTTTESTRKNAADNATEQVRLKECGTIETEVARVFCITGGTP